MNHNLSSALFIVISFFIFSSSMASNASVVQLRKDCGSLNDNDCFQTMPSLLNWIWGTSGNPTPRNPDANSPLVVEIGPGTFGAFKCNGGGHVSLRGSGRTTTEIGGPFAYIGISVIDCTNLDFANLSVSHKGSNAFWTIIWRGGGLSTWSDVDINGSGYAWLDGDTSLNGLICEPAKRGKHFWFNSRIVATSNVNTAFGYISQCGESWFYGSEIHANPTVGGLVDVVKASNISEIHLYGSVLRVTAGQNVSNNLNVVTTNGNAHIHIHGTGIDAISAEANNIFVLTAKGGVIHANETAYNLKTGDGGIITRARVDGGTVKAPYLWEQKTDPVDIVSINGADMIVESDCSATGCQTTGAETHLLIYNNACITAGPWFDVVTGKCRGL